MFTKIKNSVSIDIHMRKPLFWNVPQYQKLETSIKHQHWICLCVKPFGYSWVPFYQTSFDIEIHGFLCDGNHGEEAANPGALCRLTSRATRLCVLVSVVLLGKPPINQRIFRVTQAAARWVGISSPTMCAPTSKTARFFKISRQLPPSGRWQVFRQSRTPKSAKMGAAINQATKPREICWGRCFMLARTNMNILLTACWIVKRAHERAPVTLWG